MTPNVAAFLKTVQFSEGVLGRKDALGQPIDPYRICYGYKHVIMSFADHPAITGEWGGESLKDLGPQYADDISTAAGAYQIIRATWRDCKHALQLNDFTPPSQDDAAIWLIKAKGGLDLLNAGRFEDAVAACKGIWASLPGGTSGQPQRKLVQLQQAYHDAGGVFA